MHVVGTDGNVSGADPDPKAEGCEDEIQQGREIARVMISGDIGLVITVSTEGNILPSTKYYGVDNTLQLSTVCLHSTCMGSTDHLFHRLANILDELKEIVIFQGSKLMDVGLGIVHLQLGRCLAPTPKGFTIQLFQFGRVFTQCLEPMAK